MSCRVFADRQALGIFFRVPLLGMVKQRLASEIGVDAALDAYVSMLNTTFRRSTLLRQADVFGFFEGEALVTACIFPGVAYLRQDGVDLGERMARAFDSLFSMGYRHVVIVGADSPDLPLLFISLAFTELKTHDAVIGPSEDGGYYLIGMRTPNEALFEGISWGGPEVFNQTMAKARAAGVTVSLLPPWYDIDDAASLSRWRKSLTRTAR